MRILNSNISTINHKNKPISFRITNFHLKIILLINYFLLLSVLIIIFSTSPADSYEFSIYGAYPLYFWFLLLLSIILGMLSTILSILNNSLRKFWILGFLAGIIAVSLVLFLPLIRGYYIYGSGDILTHIGYMLDIESSGVIGRNHYPILHILGNSLFETTTLSYGIITMMIPAFFSVISILFWYILGKEIMQNMEEIVILMLIAALPIYGVMNSLFTPNHQAFLLVPLILYGLIKYQKTKDKKIGLLLIILIILLAIIHPLIAIMVILVLFLMVISDILFSRVCHDNTDSKNILKFAFIMIVIFSSWSTYLIMIVNVLKPLTASLLGTDEIKSELISKFDLISTVDIDIYSLINLGLLTYGIHLILSLITLFSIAFLFYLHFKNKAKIRRFQFFAIVCFIAFCVCGTVVFLKLDLFGMKRIMNFSLIFSLIIISSTIFIMFDKFRNSNCIKKSMILTTIVIFLIILVYLSIFSLHLSPNTKQSHQQVTEGNYIGMKNFFETRDSKIPILEYGVSQMRYHDSIYGRNFPSTNIRYGEITMPIDHFGYNISHDLGSNYDGEHYFILTKEGRGFYENMYPEFPDKWRFTDQDFQMLEVDKSVQRIYSNKNLTIYQIIPIFQQYRGIQ